MFDAVVTGGNAPRRRFGPGFVVTVAAHVVLVAFAYYVSKQPAKVVKKDQEVKFMAARLPPAPAPPPPPPLGGAAPKPKTEQPKKPPPPKKPDTFVDNKDKSDKPDPPKPSESDGSDKPSTAVGPGDPNGDKNGVDGGTPGSTGTGSVGSPPAPPPPPSGPMQYDSGGMSPVTLVGGTTAVTYTREAREAKVEGKVIARCTITEDGSLVDCRIIKHLEHLDEAVLANLRGRKYAPIMYQGRPVRVYFTFPFTFKLQ